MIIDMHRHMWSASERYHEAFVNVPQWAESKKPELDWKKTTDAMIKEMDEAGVDWSVVIVADFESRLGAAPYTIEEENGFIVEAAKRYPDRIVPFYGIDPRRPGAADSFERSIKEQGIRGLKLHSAVGFFPHDRSCYSLYELCVHYDLPVLFHCGLGFHPALYNRYTHPLEFDQVAADFRDLKMVMGHAGHDWWADCVAVARNHPNMVLELSEWQPAFAENPEEVVRIVYKMCRALGTERVVWGSDFPGLRRWMSLKDWAGVFQSLLYTGEQYGCKFTQEDIDAILGGNAARILQLK